MVRSTEHSGGGRGDGGQLIPRKWRGLAVGESSLNSTCKDRRVSAAGTKTLPGLTRSQEKCNSKSCFAPRSFPRLGGTARGGGGFLEGFEGLLAFCQPD